MSKDKTCILSASKKHRLRAPVRLDIFVTLARQFSYFSEVFSNRILSINMKSERKRVNNLSFKLLLHHISFHISYPRCYHNIFFLQ